MMVSSTQVYSLRSFHDVEPTNCPVRRLNHQVVLLVLFEIKWFPYQIDMFFLIVFMKLNIKPTRSWLGRYP